MKGLLLFLIFSILSLFPTIFNAQSDEHICKDFTALVEDEAYHHAHFLSTPKNLLTQDYDLKYHRLEWQVDPNIRYIKGSITSHFTPTAVDFGTIHFDLSEEMTVNEIVYHGNTLSYEQIAVDVLKIDLPNTIPLGQLDSIQVAYEGEPVSTGFGSFEQTDVEGNPVLWTLSEPYGAKEWWPCKQDLHDKVDSIDVIVTTPAAYRVASNGLLKEEVQEGDDKKYVWEHRYPIPAYLIAIAVTNFEVYSNFVPVAGQDDIEVLNYVFPGDLELAMGKTEKIVDIMQLFNNLVGLYPFADEKYGHAQYARTGGMEHQTMSFMGNFASDLQAHELAHQWFGDKVTCGSWEDIWLNEGFATYLTGLRKEFLDTEEHWYGWRSEAIAKVTEEPDGSVWVNDTTDVSRIFSQRLSYRKGALLLHMLRWKLGDEDFFQSIKNYLNDPDLAYGFARTIDLQNHLEAVGQMDLTEFFDDWFYNQGYPSYYINWTNTANGIEIIVDQSTSHASVDFFEMPIQVLVSGATQDTLLRLEHTVSGQIFNIDLPFQVINFEFDPELWLISRGNSINGLSGVGEIESTVPLLSILPNPFDDVLTIQNVNTPNIDELVITDISGRLIRNHENVNQPLQLDTGSWPAGLYFVKAKVGDRFYISKLVKS